MQDTQEKNQLQENESTYSFPDGLSIPDDRKEKLQAEAKRRKYTSDSWNVVLEETAEEIALENQEKERMLNLEKSYKTELKDDYQRKIEQNNQLLKKHGYTEDIEDAKLHRVIHELSGKIEDLEQKLNTKPSIKSSFVSNKGISTQNSHVIETRAELSKIIRNPKATKKQKDEAVAKIRKMTTL